MGEKRIPPLPPPPPMMPLPPKPNVVIKSEEPQPQASVQYRYRIVFVLPKDIEALIRPTLIEAEIEVGTDIGLFELQSEFRVDSIEAIYSIVDVWAQNHLPLQVEATRVYSNVIGAQTYVAGWKLEPDEKIYTTYNALDEQLQPLIQPIPELKETFKPVLFIHTKTLAEKFPRLVACLQNQFKSQQINFTQVALQRQPIPAENDAAIVEWETLRLFEKQSH